MPILTELRRKFANPSSDETLTGNEKNFASSSDETLISDARSGMRSVHFIERKFGVALSRESGRRECEVHTSRARFE